MTGIERKWQASSIIWDAWSPVLQMLQLQSDRHLLIQISLQLYSPMLLKSPGWVVLSCDIYAQITLYNHLALMSCVRQICSKNNMLAAACAKGAVKIWRPKLENLWTSEAQPDTWIPAYLYVMVSVVNFLVILGSDSRCSIAENCAFSILCVSWCCDTYLTPVYPFLWMYLFSLNFIKIKCLIIPPEVLLILRYMWCTCIP